MGQIHIGMDVQHRQQGLQKFKVQYRKKETLSFIKIMDMLQFMQMKIQLTIRIIKIQDM